MLLHSEDSKGSKISLAMQGGIELLCTDEIVRLQASGNYTKIYLKNKRPIIVSKSLKVFESMLQPEGFLRTHQSHLVNPKYIRSVLRRHLIFMEDGAVADISRRKRNAIISILRPVAQEE